MTFVVNSTTVNNSFISTIDHLPCDVIRSLWLIQSINIAVDKKKRQLDQLLRYIQLNPKESVSRVDDYVNYKTSIIKLGREAVQESKALQNQLITHKIGLYDELTQLKQIALIKTHKQTNNVDKQQLQEQLKQHYKKNPLQSQLDAINDQKVGKLSTPVNPTGLKLILKIPNRNKLKYSEKNIADKSSKLKLKLKSKKVTKSPKKKVVLPKVVAVPEVQEDTNAYCFCKQRSFGDMIACDNETSCPNGEWFHYKCVGLLNRVDALKFTTGKERWFCSAKCREFVESQPVKAPVLPQKKQKRKRKW